MYGHFINSIISLSCEDRITAVVLTNFVRKTNRSSKTFIQHLIAPPLSASRGGAPLTDYYCPMDFLPFQSGITTDKEDKLIKPLGFSYDWNRFCKI